MAGLRLDQALARLLPEHSRSRIAGWVRSDQVRVEGHAAKPKQKVWGGERIEIDAAPTPESTAYRPEALVLDIVYEDAELLVIDKPAGLVVHPGSGNWQGTLLNALLHHAEALAGLPRAGIVHRLDKDTSGLLVVAKTLPAHTSLVRQLQERTVTRVYCAFVHGEVAGPGEVDAPVGRHPTQRTRMAIVPGGRSARTHYRPVERYVGATRLECRLDTGRTHQIRVHLTSIGHPLIGDPVYKSGVRRDPAPELNLQRQALHAAKLELDHPRTGERMRWRSPLPADLKALMQQLRQTRLHETA
jgi:23S rRNA pseudouridine1911/1915/1917 synthase